MIVAPPDIFSGDESVTPTPGMETESTGNESESSTPKLFDSHFVDAMSLEGKVCKRILYCYVQCFTSDFLLRTLQELMTFQK